MKSIRTVSLYSQRYFQHLQPTMYGAAAVVKRAKKHKSPGTAPGPMPLDVPPDKPVGGLPPS
jgi:hypothetical protein